MQNIRATGYDTTHIFSDTVGSYLARIQNDTLFITGLEEVEVKSIMFGSCCNWEPITLPLHELQDQKVNIAGWRAMFPYCECYMQGFTENFELFGRSYERLNVVMDDRPMAGDAPGRTWIYSRDSGIVRFYLVDWWTQRAEGWDLLERTVP